VPRVVCELGELMSVRVECLSKSVLCDWYRGDMVDCVML